MRFRRSRQASHNGKQSPLLVSEHSSGLSDLDDESLMRELMRGSGDAFSVLYERYCSGLFWIARRVVGSDDEAEDVVQQVFLETFRSRAAFDPHKGSFRGWISQRTFDRARSRYSYLARGRYNVEPLDDNCESGFVHPETAVLAAELFSKLSPRRKEIISLRCVEGLTADEVKERTGYTESVVRNEYYRGLEELRAMVEQKSGGSPERREVSGPKTEKRKPE